MFPFHAKLLHEVAKHAFIILFSITVLNQTTTATSDNNSSIPGSNHTVAEAYQVLGISPNSDGTLTREITIPMVNATPYVTQTGPKPLALSRDIKTTKSWLRLFRPLNPPKDAKLPLVIYLHGGDFVLFSATTVIFHNFCNDVASQLPAIIVSVDYRLAPEHRLPAAFDDAVNAILWVRDQAVGISHRDPWLRKYVDLGRVFLLGSASGGNIVYQAALRSLHHNLNPMKIKGIIMNQPYFGGFTRTKSEIRLIEDANIPLYVNDVLWTLALPVNATRDHEFCNPLKLRSYFGRVKRLPRVMVKGNTGDPLVDRGRKLVKFLKSRGVQVVNVIVEGGFHGVELNNATAAQELYGFIKDFVYST